MAFETHLIAMAWINGRYEIASQIQAPVDIRSITKDDLFNDVSADSGYLDEVAILQKDDFAKYFLPKENPWYSEAVNWYASLPKEVYFIMVHKAEWESGLND